MPVPLRAFALSRFRVLFELPGAAIVLAMTLLAASCRQDHPSPHHPPPTPFSAHAITFRDVAAASGIRFVDGHGGRSPLNIRETAGHGCAFLDVDGDGRLDILLVGEPRCTLYRNRGGAVPTFEDITAAAGLDLKGDWMGCATGDYDNDGRVDLALTGYRCAALLHNEGGRFRDTSTGIPLARGAWNTSAAFFDADGDGLLDLYVGAYVQFDHSTLQLCDYSGVLTACPPTYYDPERGHLYHNLGNGRFADITRQAGLGTAHGKTLGVAAADYDGDGRTDLYLANDGMPGDLFHNRGGRFVNVGSESGTAFNYDSREQAGMGVDWGDYDNDGRLDLVVSTFQYEPTSLYHNQGHPGTVSSFPDRAENFPHNAPSAPPAFIEEAFPAGIGDATLNRLGFGIKFFDADNDGDLDLIQANGHVQNNAGRIFPGVTYRQSTLLFENIGDGRFRDISASAGEALARPIVGRGLAVGDYDNDGSVDVLIANLEGAPLLLHNETLHPGRSLTIRLVGRASPRDGTGAPVTLRAGGRTQVREAGTGGSYLSAGDPRLHFGLGAAALADSLTVRWPSGITQTLHHVPAGKELTIHEAASR
jgi:enediyne biosynthesis protein E4